MGIFGFFKSKKPVEVEVEVEKISFGDIKGWLENKEQSLLKNEKVVLEEIGGKLNEFYVSIEDKLEILEGIDIESKKEHGRAKILVRQGLDKYVNSVRILLKDIDGLGKDNLGKFAMEIAGVFNRFEKTSAIFYGRANYLIGDEMAAVRNEVRRFYNGLADMFEGNKLLVDGSRKIGNVKLKLKELLETKNDFVEIEREIEKNDLGIDKVKDVVRKLEDEIEVIRNSNEHISGVEARDEIENLKIGLNGEIGKLKELVDFKRLTNLVHSNEKELQIVKDFRAHFIHEFSRDEGLRLFGLMEGTSLKSAEIGVQVDLIKGKVLELGEKSKAVGIDYTVKKLDEMKGLNESIENMELGSVKADRRLEDLRLKMKGMKNEVVLLVEGFGVKIK